MGPFPHDAAPAEITTQKIADGLHVLFGIGGNIAVSIGEDGVFIVDDQLAEAEGHARLEHARAVDHIGPCQC